MNHEPPIERLIIKSYGKTGPQGVQGPTGPMPWIPLASQQWWTTVSANTAVSS